jgi:hypothetical protein
MGSGQEKERGGEFIWTKRGSIEKFARTFLK